MDGPEPRFRQISLDDPLPGCTEMQWWAELMLTPEEWRERCGVAFTPRGWDPGLGPLFAARLVTGGGRVFTLHWHEGSPIPHTLLLPCSEDLLTSAGTLTDEFLEAVGLDRTAVRWEADPADVLPYLRRIKGLDPA